MQSFVFLPDNPIAFACLLCETMLVENGYMGAVIVDHAGLLKRHGGLGNAHAAHAQHFCNRLLVHDKLMWTCVVTHRQQPAREALIYAVMLTARYRLADHRKKCARVVK